jgi:hypothetical protein
MASGKVVAVKFVPRPLAKSAIPFMMAEVEIQVSRKMTQDAITVLAYWLQLLAAAGMTL